jgi:16S rRNA (uracil1498-N3)-methyltransferase
MTRILLSAANLDAIENDEEFDLDSDTAKKLVRVLRLTSGETFLGFDGRGREWECALTFVEAQKKPAARAIALEEVEAVQSEPKLHLSVAQAIPKGDKMELVLQKGTELGVREFWPFESERTVKRVAMEEDDGARATARGQRWRKIVEAAAMQCGRKDVPIVHAIADFSTVVGAGTNAGRCFMLDESPDAVSLREVLQREGLAPAGSTPGADAGLPIMLLIGPEGGWTQSERDWAQRYGVEAINLGKRILRTETAALVAAAILNWEAGEF